MKGLWKVPFRAVYCQSFSDMVKQTIWCLFVVKVFPNVVDFDSAPLDRQYFLQQFEFMFRRAEWTRILKDEKASPVEKLKALSVLASPLSIPPAPLQLQAYQGA